jgi:hypothetical protein
MIQTAYAAALGGHLVHVIVIGGALLLAVTVYGVAALTAPAATPERAGDLPPTADAGRVAVPPPRARARGDRSRSVAIAQQLACLGLAAAAGTHLAVMPEHFRQSWLYGCFFAVVAPLQIALAWLVLARPRRAELSAALAFSLGVVVLWAFTRFVGVPIGPDNGATEELGVLDIFATLAELLSAGALVYVLRSGRYSAQRSVAPAWRWSLWPALTRAILAATVVAVPLLSIFASRS